MDIEDPEANEEKCDRFAAVGLGLRVSEDGARNLSACLLKGVYVSWEPESKVFNPLMGSIGQSNSGTGHRSSGMAFTTRKGPFFQGG